jgi:hypothetical protein
MHPSLSTVWGVASAAPAKPNSRHVGGLVDGGEEQGVVCFGTAKLMQKYLRAGLVFE